jgi:hypothetical protein
MHVPLTGETLRIERLEHAAATVCMQHDRLDPDSHGRLLLRHDRHPPHAKRYVVTARTMFLVMHGEGPRASLPTHERGVKVSSQAFVYRVS